MWTAGFDHVPNGSSVHPASDSISMPSLWITENPATYGGPSSTPGQGMNTVHASLIPAGVHRGEVLLFDGNLTRLGPTSASGVSSTGTRSHQPWSIVNPYWPAPNPNFWPGQPATQYRFHNGLLVMPPGEGELFCAGHCWLPDGRLLVAGGTKAFPPPQGPSWAWEGARLLYQWDPTATPGNPFGTWWRMANLEAFRWYPTVRVDGTRDWRAIVIGGSHWSPGISPENQQVNSYEAVRFVFSAQQPQLQPSPQDFDRKPVPTQPTWWPGTVAQPAPSVRQYWGPNVPLAVPALGVTSYQGFREYPRPHALGVLDPISGGTAPRLFVCGQPLWGMHWAHDEFVDPTFGAAVTGGVGYNIGQFPANGDRYAIYGTSLLMPSAVGGQQSQVVRIGGMRLFQTGASDLVETVQANIPATTQSAWSTSMPKMHHPRMHLNVVVLPTGELFAIGGEGPVGAYHLTPELLINGGTAWQDMAPHAGPRDYHSTALLLPDARVFVAGGEHRKSGASPGPDYLIYEPQYFHMDYGSVPPSGIDVVNDTTGQPVLQDAAGPQGMPYGSFYRASWSNTLEDGITVASAVLISPSSVTHHDDGGQRFVRLVTYYDDDQTGQPTNSIKFRSPGSERVAPPGWWMLFLVTSSGRPSSAYWVHLL